MNQNRIILLAASNKVIIQGRGGTTAPIVLTPDMFRPKASAAPAAQPQAQTAEPAR